MGRVRIMDKQVKNMPNNRLFNFLKSTFVFQDILSWLRIISPPILDHNLGKYDALKKTFYLSALDNLHGDYCEFGVFTGSSFVCAMRAHKSMRNIADVKTRFYGFDSFSGFGKVSEEDKHEFYLNNTFTINKKKVLKFIQKKAKRTGNRYKIIDGFFENTLKNRTCKDYGIEKVRIVFIDCDMKQPARIALDFIRPGMQEGMILIMDDFFSYKGSKEKGVAGAFYNFCEKHKEIHFRHVFEYGCVGSVYIIDKIERR